MRLCNRDGSLLLFAALLFLFAVLLTVGVGCDLTAVYTQDDWDDAKKRVKTFIEHNNEVLDDEDLRNDPDVRQAQKDEGESLNVYMEATSKAGRGEDPRADDDEPIPEQEE